MVEKWSIHHDGDDFFFRHYQKMVHITFEKILVAGDSASFELILPMFPKILSNHLIAEVNKDCTFEFLVK